jgi:hypothetical protein
VGIVWRGLAAHFAALEFPARPGKIAPRQILSELFIEGPRIPNKILLVAKRANVLFVLRRLIRLARALSPQKRSKYFPGSFFALRQFFR